MFLTYLLSVSINNDWRLAFYGVSGKLVISRFFLRIVVENDGNLKAREGSMNYCTRIERVQRVYVMVLVRSV